MTTTRQARRAKRNTGSLKVLLLSSSLIATLAGTQLLNIKEALQPAAVLAVNNVVTVVEPQPETVQILMPPVNGRQQIVLRQIPQAVQPQIRPVARARSSR